MTVWRLHVKPAFGDISDYCLKNNVAAMGWSFAELLDGKNPALEEKVKKIKTYEDFMECADANGYGYMSVPQLHDAVQAGDLIWMHAQGRYYLSMVSEKSHWQFCHEARKIDAANQLTDIFWIEAGDDTSAPDALKATFGPFRTLQRVSDPDVEAFSLWLWRALSK